MPLKITSHKVKPTMKEERRLARSGYRFIAGLDEVGRGCLAGPVASSAVIMPLNCRQLWLQDVRDSKFLSPKRRDFLYDKILSVAVAYGTGMVDPAGIDAIGIAAAVRLAMTEALAQLSPAADSLLIDRFTLPESPLPQWGIINGDSICLSIACASIVAKVTRDRLMVQLGQGYPDYNFARHKGYATSEHYAAIAKLGLSPIHRRSFCKSAVVPAANMSKL